MAVTLASKNKEWRDRHSIRMKQAYRNRSVESLEKQKKAVGEALRRPEVRKKLSLISKRYWRTEKYKQKRLIAQRNGFQKRSVATLERISRLRKKLAIESWKNEDHRKRRLEAMARGWRKNPNKFEKEVGDILKSLGVRYKSQVRIGMFVADFFIRKLGLVIECDGEYWHNSERDKKKNKAYRKAGLKLLRIPWRRFQSDPSTYVSRIAEVTQ